MTYRPPGPGTPPAELTIDEALVRRLLEEQHPDVARLPLREFGSGWDNVMYRLGDDLAVRLPRREIAEDLIVNEQRWLPILAPTLPIAVPTPVRIGHPSDNYPWHWSLLRWLPGNPADIEPLAASQAERLADFLSALHAPAPADAPRNPVRGIPLRDRQDSFADRLERIRPRLAAQLTPVTELWQMATETEIDVAGHWLHGDPHPQNVLVHNGIISGIIDWGDVTAGDPANDLAALWMLLDEPATRYRATARYNPTQQTYRRAMGWAVYFGVILLDVGTADNPRHAKVGQDTLDRVIADAKAAGAI